VLKSSLLLIAPDHLRIFVDQWDGKKKFRARFTYRTIDYDLSLTDPIYRSRYARKALGEYELAQPAYLCISLGEPFGTDVYKLVASIITESDRRP
jgi:hypothetical protein